MLLADITFPSPEENLACDEALHEMCEEKSESELLRFWEPARHFIVLGHGSHVRDDVHVDAASHLGVPLVRRYSGGGTVVQGPGCLNYTLVLRIPERGPLTTITGTTAHVMGRNARALQTLTSEPIRVCGFSDLTIDDKKFSGNAQRRTRRCVLFHGTVLTGMDLALIDAVLRLPARQPEYRHNRSHSAFLRAFPATASEVKNALRLEWGANAPFGEIPDKDIRRIAKSRYSNPEWTFHR